LEMIRSRLELVPGCVTMTLPSTTSSPVLYTPITYLEAEEQATHRSEYWDGILKPMAGGTANHNRIAGEFYRQILSTQSPSTIAGQSYDVFMGDMKLWITATLIVSLSRYPRDSGGNCLPSRSSRRGGKSLFDFGGVI
jgi:Uma2 family endonuclease